MFPPSTPDRTELKWSEECLVFWLVEDWKRLYNGMQNFNFRITGSFETGSICFTTMTISVQFAKIHETLPTVTSNFFFVGLCGRFVFFISIGQWDALYRVYRWAPIMRHPVQEFGRCSLFMRLLIGVWPLKNGKDMRTTSIRGHLNRSHDSRPSTDTRHACQSFAWHMTTVVASPLKLWLESSDRDRIMKI